MSNEVHQVGELIEELEQYADHYQVRVDVTSSQSPPIVRKVGAETVVL